MKAKDKPLADDKVLALIEKRDRKGWPEVMALAQKYGFILSAGGGVAMLATNDEQLKLLGEKEFLFQQEQFYEGGFFREDEPAQEAGR